MFGYCSRGSAVYDSAPMSTIRTAIEIAKFGRWMKNWLSTMAPRLLGRARHRGQRGSGLRRGGDWHPGPHLLQALHNHALSGAHPAVDGEEGSVRVAGGDRSQRDRVIRSDDEDGPGTLDLLHRGLEDEHGVGPVLQLRTHPGVHRG